MTRSGATTTHHESAGDPASASHALRAASRAVESLAFNKGADFYQRAIRSGRLSGLELSEAYRRLGDAYANAGRGPESSAADPMRGASLAADGEAVALRSNAASQLLRCGHASEGLELLNSLLREVGLRPARTRAMAIVNIVGIAPDCSSVE